MDKFNSEEKAAVIPTGAQRPTREEREGWGKERAGLAALNALACMETRGCTPIKLIAITTGDGCDFLLAHGRDLPHVDPLLHKPNGLGNSGCLCGAIGSRLALISTINLGDSRSGFFAALFVKRLNALIKRLRAVLNQAVLHAANGGLADIANRLREFGLVQAGF